MKGFLKILSVITICSSILFTSAYARYIPVKGNPATYTDISGHWAYDSMCYVIQNGYFKGTEKDKFMPDTNMSRAMLVTVLWRTDRKRSYIHKDSKWSYQNISSLC